MITTIYHDQKFGLIKDEKDKVTITLNQNNSLLYTHSSNAFSFEQKYENLDDLLKDGSISELAKWLARGLLGIPPGDQYL
jgi:hypothetical protein